VDLLVTPFMVLVILFICLFVVLGIKPSNSDWVNKLLSGLLGADS
jgi:hypothetical protein